MSPWGRKKEVWLWVSEMQTIRSFFFGGVRAERAGAAGAGFRGAGLEARLLLGGGGGGGGGRYRSPSSVSCEGASSERGGGSAYMRW